MQRLHSKPRLRPRNNSEESKALLDAIETLHGVHAAFVAEQRNSSFGRRANDAECPCGQSQERLSAFSDDAQL